MDRSRETLFPLYAGLITPVWLRLLGMKIGRGAEVSTVLALPSLTAVGEGAFLADDTLTAPYELGGGWMRIGRRAFLGNSGMTAPGRSVPDGGLVGVLSATPKKAKKGSSYLGLPPVKLPRSTRDGDQSRTYDPPARLLWARALVELCRIVPVFCSAALAVLTVAALSALGVWAPLLAGIVFLGVGVLACLTSVVAKWLLVGRHRAGEHPLWSGFVWRNELADTFVEVVAVPWLAGSARYAADDGVAARPRRPYRQGRMDRALLAARDGPGDPGGRDHGQPGLCPADPPLPRPDLADGYCCPP